MKYVRMVAALIAAMISGPVSAQSNEAPAPQEGLSHMTVAQARSFAEAAGGTVRAVEDLEDGDYEMTIDYPDGIPVYVRGYSCSGAGEAKRCSEFESSVYFGFDNEAEALAAEHAMDIVWLSDKQIEDQLKVWRYEFVAGSTAAHLRATFRTFLETVWAAQDIVDPVSPDGEAARS